MATNENGNGAAGDSTTMIKLTSSDGQIFTVKQKAAFMSKTIKDMCETLGITTGEEDPIPLPNVDGATLKKVLEWAEHHMDDAPPEPEDDYSKDKRHDDLFSTWDAQFLRVEEDTIFELTLAANYLEMNGLLDLTCKVIANMLRGKTPEWCREKYGIVNDFTPEEEEQIRKENEWCDDK